MSSAESAQVFADALLGDHGEVLAGLKLSVSWFVPGEPSPRTRLVAAQPSVLASAVTALAADSETLGVYVGVGLTRGYRAINPRTGRPFSRLAKPDVVGLAWLWVDIDVAGGGHAESKMPLAADKATAVAIARSTGLAPTLLVDTGHGIQAHWRLAEPWIFGCVDYTDDGVPIIDESRVEADRRAAERFAWEWIKSFQIRSLRDFGAHVDSTTDTARLVRVPGSLNTKLAGDHREVLILECEPTRRYDLDQVRAVLAPEKLLSAQRFDTQELTGSLAGVDLPGLFAACRTYPRFEPEWLIEVIDSGWSPELTAIWSGAADERYGGDDSTIDMALAATVLHCGLDAGMAVEAVMCRRLRIGRKVEKVDPAQRVSYLEMTIGKCVATLKEQQARREAHSGSTAAGIAAATAAPSQPQAVPDRGAEVATDVVASGPTPNENAVTLEVGPGMPLRLVEPEPDLVARHADAPAAPVQGVEGTLPAPLPPERHVAADQLAMMLGLPAGVSIWTVGERRMEDHDEIRLWLRRTGASRVYGGTWGPNTVKPTRWRPKSDWKTRNLVAGLLWDDLHLLADVGRGWPTEETGMRRLWELVVPMRDGTQEELAELAIGELLVKATGTGLLATAAMTRDPWLHEDAVWVPMANIRDEFSRMGAKPPSMVDMVDLLMDMSCKVEKGIKHDEGNRTVRDGVLWVRIADDLISPELGAQVVMRAADRDAQDARADIRGIT